MKRLFTHRAGHYALLTIVGALLFLPNLGAHSLWDVDESHNAECAREMLSAGDWVVPTFNFKLRPDKPVLQYWLIMASYQWLGVSEFAARLVSVLAGVGSVLLTYELGRRMFDAATGLLAGLVLASSFMFCVSAHAVTPDALLILLTVASFFVFWWGYCKDSQSWLLPFGVITGLAVLTKGPVGLVLPFGVNGLFLLWERRLRRLYDWRLVAGCVLFALVAAPWYMLVAAETKWEFWQGFFLKHNLQRFQATLEGHRGPIFYHPFVLIAAFAPWSVFLGLTAWYALGRRMKADRSNASSVAVAIPSNYRFLWCWIAVWFIFFSLASTKLPNYVLPAYPALAILTARFLRRWQTGAIAPPRWLMGICLGSLALVGVCISGGMLVASGAIAGIDLRGRTLPELGPWALVGLIPVLAAVSAGILLRRDRRLGVLASVTSAAVLLVAVCAAAGPVVVDQHKVTRALGTQVVDFQLEREVQLGCYRYYQPGLVYYAQRRVEIFATEQDALDHLHSPLQTFLFVTAEDWELLKEHAPAAAAAVACKHDFMTGKDVLLVTNHTSAERRASSPPLAVGSR